MRKEGERALIGTEAHDTVRTFDWPRRIPGRPSAPAFWLVCRYLDDYVHILTLDRRDPQDKVLQHKTLPVFGYEEEAKAFLELGALGVDDGGWMVRESGVEELLWLLRCPEGVVVRKVALDPLPEMVADGTLGLVSMFRERFIERLVARGRRLLLCEPAFGSSCTSSEKKEGVTS